MARAVIFKTNGLIPIEAFTTMGINAKPNSENPIGHFGTGLKYAIAVLVREKIPVTVYIGRDEYKFFAKEHKFRGKAFDFVTMKATTRKLLDLRIREHRLPFTTELGKNWVLWQAFRELYSNTLDESGEAYLVNEGYMPAESGKTFIVVEGEKFVKEFLDREKNFLPDGFKVRDDSTGEIQVLERPSQHIYYRGLRIHDLEHPSELTYNFLSQVELTEDRTAKSPYDLEFRIKAMLLTSENESVVKKAVEAPKNTFEGRLEYTYNYHIPSPIFKDAIKSPKASSSASSYVRTREPKPEIVDPFKEHPRPWKQIEDTIVDATNKPVLCKKLDSGVSWELLRHVVQAVNNYKPGVLEGPEDSFSKVEKPSDRVTPLDEEIPF